MASVTGTIGLIHLSIAATPIPRHRYSMSQPLLILLELLLLGILSWYCITIESADIEADLNHRSAAALGYAGLDQLNISVDGQDITLRGTITSDDQRILAVESIANVWGIRQIHDELQLHKPSAPPTDARSDATASPEEATATTDEAATAQTSALHEQCQSELEAITGDRKLHFSLGSDELAPGSLSLLHQIADLLQQCPQQILHIVGHTDSIGRAKDNLALSQARATAVAKQLTKLGIPPRRLQALGKGESEPIADNTTAAGREANRRITFEFQSVPRNDLQGKEP